jgi:hypothetical protein
MGRTKIVQLGHIDGAAESLLPLNTPATNVPWKHAWLFAFVHATELLRISWILEVTKLGCPIATGPSINPNFISGMPEVNLVNFSSPTRQKGSIITYPSFVFLI